MKMEPHNLPSINCCYSSMIFITNAIVTYYYKYYLYSLLFVALTVSCVIHHSTKTPTTYYIDKLFVFSIVGYGGYVFYNKILDNSRGIEKYLYYSIIIGTFLGTIVLYYYGSINNSLCFAEDRDECDHWHQLMHIISSIGHNFIVLL